MVSNNWNVLPVADINVQTVFALCYTLTVFLGTRETEKDRAGRRHVCLAKESLRSTPG